MFLKEKEDTNYNATQQRGKAKASRQQLGYLAAGLAGEAKVQLAVLWR